MATLTVDLSGRRGLAKRSWGDLDESVPTPNFRYLAEDGQTVGGYYNPFKTYGYLNAANNGFTDVTRTTDFTAVPNCVAYDDVNDAIIVGSKGRYFQVLSGGLDDTSFTLGSNIGDLGTIGTPSIKDMEIYQINGVRKLFVIYEIGGSVEITHYPLPYDSAAGTDFFQSAAGGAIDFKRMAFMRVADNGFAYQFIDNTVHKIDGTTNGGTDGSATANVLVFPTTFTITDAVDYRGSMFMAIVQAPVVPSEAAAKVANYTLPCGVYVWDRQSTVTGTTDYIPVLGIRVIHRIYVTNDGVLRIIVTNGEGVTEIREYNGSAFVTIEEVGRQAFPAWHDSVVQEGGFTIWLANTGDITAHGKIAPGERDGLYKIGNLSDANTVPGDNTGFIFFGGANTYTSGGTSGTKSARSGLYLGYVDSNNSVQVKQWDMYGTGVASAAGTNNTVLQGDVYFPVQYLSPMSTLKNITVFMVPGPNTGSSSTGTIKIYLNQSATPWATKTVTREDQARGYVRIEINKPYVNAVQLEIEWPDSVFSGDNLLAPSIAIMEYEPETDKG